VVPTQSRDPTFSGWQIADLPLDIQITAMRDHTADQLSQDGDEYTPREVDEAGEKKVEANGQLLGGREYKCRTFCIPNRGDKLFMLAAECARVFGYRDSYSLFLENKLLYKIIASQTEKGDLIRQEILPFPYRSRQVSIVTARSIFRQFGSRAVVDGRRVRDDYWEVKARKEGFTEEDRSGEKRPGAVKVRDAAATAETTAPPLAQGDKISSSSTMKWDVSMSDRDRHYIARTSKKGFPGGLMSMDPTRTPAFVEAEALHELARSPAFLEDGALRGLATPLPRSPPPNSLPNSPDNSTAVSQQSLDIDQSPHPPQYCHSSSGHKFEQTMKYSGMKRMAQGNPEPGQDLSQPNHDSKDVLETITQQILFSLRNPIPKDPKRKRQRVANTSATTPNELDHLNSPQKLTATFHLRWSLAEFMKEQFCESPQKLIGSVIALTGSATCAQATTVRDYLKRHWPDTGLLVLEILQKALDLDPSAEGKLTALEGKLISPRFGKSSANAFRMRVLHGNESVS
jgi:hypothetical protein